MSSRTPFVLCILLLFTAGLPGSAFAKEDQEAAHVQAALQARFPDISVAMPRPSPIPDYYEVEMGGQVFYVSKNGRYLLNGDVIDLRRDENLSEARRMVLRRKVLDAIPPSDMVIIGLPGARRHVTVFTNIDCYYCRQLNAELQNLAARGNVQIRYVLLPEGRPDSAVYARTVSVWCAPNRIVALNRAMEGGKVPSYQCPAPLGEFVQAAKRLNIRGLPTLFLENGAMISGMPPQALLENIMQIAAARK